jgi:hypothetical protein
VGSAVAAATAGRCGPALSSGRLSLAASPGALLVPCFSRSLSSKPLRLPWSSGTPAVSSRFLASYQTHAVASFASLSFEAVLWGGLVQQTDRRKALAMQLDELARGLYSGFVERVRLVGVFTLTGLCRLCS